MCQDGNTTINLRFAAITLRWFRERMLVGGIGGDPIGWAIDFSSLREAYSSVLECRRTHRGDGGG